MQATTNKRVSQKPGPDFIGRAKKHEVVRCGRRTGQVAPTVALGRFHPIKHEHKLGINILSKLNILNAGDLGGKQKTVLEIYKDLLPCFNRYYLLYHGHQSDTDFLKITNGDAGLAIQKMLTMFKIMLGESIHFSIRQDTDDSFYLLAFQEANYREQWNIFQVGPTLKKLSRWYPEVADVFVDFLGAFSKSGAEFWWNHQYGYYTSDFLKEELLNGSYEDESQKRKVRREIKKYEEGIAHKFQCKIVNAIIANSVCHYPGENLDRLEQKLKTIKGCRSIKKIIRAGIKVLRPELSIQDFGTQFPAGYDDYEQGLMYEDTHNVIWDAEDNAQSLYEEWINVEAGEGLYPAFQSLKVNRYTKSIFKPSNWLVQLNDFFDLACDEINKFNTPKKKRNGPTK